MEDSTNTYAAARRSGRERTTTTIQIDGHTVLRKNNHTVTGMEYIWGDDNPEKNNESQPPEPKKQKVDTAARAPYLYKPSDHEILRRQHNLRIAKAKNLKICSKGVSWPRIKPFCEPSVIQDLQNTLIEDFQAEAVQEQPQAIRATPRDYQVQGLNFMVQMDRQNLPMILGDAMGLALQILPS